MAHSTQEHPMATVAKNPSTIWCCAPGQDTLEQAQAFLKQHHVRFVLAQFVDIHGGLKSKSVPVECLPDLLETGAGFAGPAIAGYGLHPQSPEYMLVADLSTLQLLPWMPGYARIMGTGMVAGKPHPNDPRNLLKAQVERLSERGWTFNTGLEPEFMLLKQRADGQMVPFDDTDTMAKPAYDYKGLTRNRAFIEQVSDSLQAVGIKVYQIDHEDANGQYEVNFKYADALTSADNMQFFKMVASETAHDLGALCSFMPKLSATSTGNGMHAHCSIADSNGRNLFHDPSDPSGMALSPLAYHFIAGVLAHAKGLTALLAPSVNSYKRLVRGSPGNPSWAPVYIAYGDNNRSAMLRIPPGRVEVRTGDAGMNPYVATAAIIAAGLDGIDRKLQPGAAHSVNFYEQSPLQVRQLGVDVLPTNLDRALEALESDSLFAEALGAGFVDAFLQIKRQEWAQYHQTVSDWEIQRYATFF
jgi:glutamine synthetase